MTRASPRIAYVLRAFPCPSETFILREMSTLVERGADLRIYALSAEWDRPAPPSVQQLLPRVVYADKLQRAAALNALVCRPKTTLRAVVGAASGFARALYRLPPAAYFSTDAAVEDVQHVHAHFAGVPAEIACLMARLIGVEYSVSVHAWDLFAQAPQRVAASVRDASFVVACTRSGRDHLHGICPFLPADRVHCIHHGVPIPPAPVPPIPDEPVVLGVGRLVEKKGFGCLVDACAELASAVPGFRCRIVGDGPLRTVLEQQIGERGLAGCVELTGWLPVDEVAEHYRQASVLAAPSVITADGDRDGLPNVILEAMAHARPVVASEVAGIPEAVRDGENGFLVPPGDPQALARSLVSVLGDRALCARLGENGRARAERDFDVQRSARPLFDLFAARSAL